MLVAAALVGVVASCEESVGAGAACPAVCPQQSLGLRDTTFYAVEFDTAISGFPHIGTESQIVLARRPDTIDSRGIVRFDSVQTVFRHKGVTTADSDLVSIDTAYIKLRIAKADTLGPNLFIEIYDVDLDTTQVTQQEDTALSALLPLFSDTRLIGSKQFTADSLKDSLIVPIDLGFTLDRLKDPDRHFRIGIRAVAPVSASLNIYTTNSGFAPILYVRPSGDSTIEPIQISAFSKTPSSEDVAAELADFQIVAFTPPSPAADAFRIGGAPGSRGYLRFNIPAPILDSSSVVRATLLLTQSPSPGAPDAKDTAAIVPYELVAGGAITDLTRALQFTSFPMDSTRIVPADGGVREFEIIEALRRWRLTTASRTPRAIALQGSREGLGAWQADFFSQRAPLAVRPRLRITYIPTPPATLP